MTKILVIEDDLAIREIINDILSLVNFEVIEAENGQQGVEIAFSTLPDLIICDIMMPRLDGYGVLQKLQHYPETESIPFIFLTAKGTPLSIRKGMNLGADDYLTKPFSEDGLLQAITTRLKKRASVKQLYINELQQAEEKLDFILRHDPLTNLPNQLLLREIFEEIVSKNNLECPTSSAPRQTSPNSKIEENLNSKYIPVFSIGLDRFRRINETLGYHLGDLLLKAAAKRLTRCINKRGAIARLSGDEFVIILNPVVYKHDAAQIAQEILNTFAQSFIINNHEIFISLSIGIACYPRDSNKLEELLQKSNLTMKRVKQRGGMSFDFYSVLIQKTLVSNCLDLEADLRHALKRNELQVYYQPQVSLKTGKVVGAEALVRWLHPKRGSVSPGIFIPIAEETGVIESIGEWVLRTACQQYKTWQESGLFLMKIAVNLSGRQFNQKDLTLWLDRILQEIGFDSKSLELELTESILVENPAVSVLKLRGIKALGVKIAIDDFGTGYSSFSYLQQFPFDVLKIDQCFVASIDRNSKNAEITKAIISLAHHLNLMVVAEGVETQEEFSFLQQHNCDEMQGFLFSRPIQASEFENLVRSQSYLVKSKV